MHRSRDNAYKMKPHHEKTQQFAYAKTKAQISFAVTAKLISAFVFATRIVQFLFVLKPKFPVSSHLLCQYSSICVGPFQKPHCWFSHEAAEILKDSSVSEMSNEPRRRRNFFYKYGNSVQNLLHFISIECFCLKNPIHYSYCI